jgi:hypothetical protein
MVLQRFAREGMKLLSMFAMMSGLWHNGEATKP